MGQLVAEKQQTIEKSIKITNNSILERLKAFDGNYFCSIAEYIWNAFDADAKNIWIDYRFGVQADYGTTFKRSIENMRHQGEESKGLVEYIESERTKIYVRKWSGAIIEARR